MTAEFAVLMPAVILLLGAVLGAASAGMAQIRCIDAARTAARLAARHEPAAKVVAAARSAAPPGARVVLTRAGSAVRVTVSARVSLPVPGRPKVEVRAASDAELEEAGVPGDVEDPGR